VLHFEVFLGGFLDFLQKTELFGIITKIFGVPWLIFRFRVFFAKKRVVCKKHKVF
jgi:hypothetical protein